MEQLATPITDTEIDDFRHMLAALIRHCALGRRPAYGIRGALAIVGDQTLCRLLDAETELATHAFLNMEAFRRLGWIADWSIERLSPGRFRVGARWRRGGGLLARTIDVGGEARAS